MTRERAAELLSGVTVLDDPEMAEAHRVAISALRQQDHFREVTKKVEPMTLDDAIAHLDDTLSDTGRKWSCESCRMEHVQLRAWLAELRDIKQNQNEPLTLDELRQMAGEPVWLHTFSPVQKKTNVAKWSILETVGSANATFLRAGVNSRLTKWFCNYGERWLAYRQKPEEGTV